MAKRKKRRKKKHKLVEAEVAAPKEEPTAQAGGQEGGPEETAPASTGGPACPVCGDAGALSEDKASAACRTCGTLFLVAPSAAADIAREREARFSRAFGMPNHRERATAKAFAREAMAGYFKVTRGKPAALNAFGKNVLEVDCGLGFRLRCFQDYGWTVAGTETSASAFEYARRQSLDVRHGSLEDASFGSTKFDLAVFSSCFGEVADPAKAVEKLWQLMRPGGHVCLLHEPVVVEGNRLVPGPRAFLYTPDSVRRVFCGNRFAFADETLDEDTDGHFGSFFFQAKYRG